MAFKSYDELIRMASNNPRQATKFVKSAQQSNRPVVSVDNPGYEDNPRAAALKRSMKRKMLVGQDSTVTSRKNNNY